MQKITPFLWFDKEAEEAAKFYTSIFKNSRIDSVSRYDEASAKSAGLPKGTVMTVAFSLDGQQFTALNGGPEFKFTEAVSFVVTCKDQQEIDNFWGKLSAHSESEQCGWLKDKYGLSWQIIPENLNNLLKNPLAMPALMKMKKIIIANLERT